MILHLSCRNFGIDLRLPASDTDVKRTFSSLRDGLEGAAVRISGVCGSACSLHRYIQHTDLENGDDLEQELRVFGAALEVEEPRSFREAGTIAMDRDDYELVPGSEREYGMEALRYAGAGDELLEILDGFTDFDTLGRFVGAPGETQRSGFAGERSRSVMSELWPQAEARDMELAATKKDGVRETSYGSVKRLSAPFPQQAEQGQTMY